MFCTVYRLRRHGTLLRPADPLYMLGLGGVLTVDRGQGTRDVHAVLHDVDSGDELIRLHDARLVKIAGGGVLLSGHEMHFRGIKSKGEPARQTWWCVPLAARFEPKDAAGLAAPK